MPVSLIGVVISKTYTSHNMKHRPYVYFLKNSPHTFAQKTFFFCLLEFLGEESPSFNALVGWFDTDFAGTNERPVGQPITLTTAPSEDGPTHWGQQQFHVVPSIEGTCSVVATQPTTQPVDRYRDNLDLFS